MPARGRVIAQELGVTVEAELLPDQKVAAIERVRRAFGPVCMVGDGINDAPALAASDVGIALGCGTDVSRDSASVCLLGDDLSRIPWSIELARRTRRVIRWNLIWAFGYNSLGVAFAALGWLNPALAAFLMVASSALVTVNSLRLSQPFEIALDGCGIPARSRRWLGLRPPAWRTRRSRLTVVDRPIAPESSHMIELPLVFLGGLLGSAHCVGMCGGFAVTIGIGSRGLPANLRRQLIYTAGRIFTYSFFGVAAGYTGFWLAVPSDIGGSMPRRCSCVIAGLLAAGQDSWPRLVPRRFWPKAQGAVDLLGRHVRRAVLASPRLSDVLSLESSPAFCPAAWSTAFWLWRAARRTSGTACLTMILFGAGTAPLMILAGAGGPCSRTRCDDNLLRISAVCVGLTGLVSIVRGILFVQTTAAPEVVRCLFCGPAG